jgi:hypothetical protein
MSILNKDKINEYRDISINILKWLYLYLHKTLNIIENIPPMIGKSIILMLTLSIFALQFFFRSLLVAPKYLWLGLIYSKNILIVVINSIPRIANWLITIGFAVIGLTLYVSFMKIGLIFIMIAIFISPYMNDFFGKAITASNKVVIILLGLTGSIISLNYESDETRFLVGFLIETTWLDEDKKEDLKKLKEYIAIDKQRQVEEAYLARREQQLVEIETLYNNGFYQEAIFVGTPYITFEPEIRNLVDKSRQIQKTQQIETALEEVPQLMRVGQYQEAYQLAKPLYLEAPELQNYVVTAKEKLDKDVDKLSSWYQRGKYKQIVDKASAYTEIDCRIRKIVNKAKKSEDSKAERRRFRKALKTADNFIKKRKYQDAIDFILNSEYVKHSRMQKRIQRAITKNMKYLIKRRKYIEAIQFGSQSVLADDKKVVKLIKKAKYRQKKIEEKKILARLRNIPDDYLEANIREYSHLVNLFPNNRKYKNKLDNYKRRLVAMRKQPPKLITKDMFGDQWPFTVSEGELECLPPALVTFKVNGIIYAVNSLASSRGYQSINRIWKTDPNRLNEAGFPAKADISPIVHTGLALCNPN